MIDKEMDDGIILKGPNIVRYTRLVNSVVEYMAENVSSPETLDEISTRFRVSKYHFSRVFSSITGETPKSFYRRIRLETALRMIRSIGARNLSDIAAALGFSSTSNFTRDFIMRYGFPPSTLQDNFSHSLGRGARSTFDEFSFLGFRSLHPFPVLYRRVYDGRKVDAINVAFNEIIACVYGTAEVPKGVRFMGSDINSPTHKSRYLGWYDACVEIEATRDFSGMTAFDSKRTDGGDYAVYAFSGYDCRVIEALDAAYGDLAHNGIHLYARRLRLDCFTDYCRHAEKYYQVEFHIPIRASTTR